MKGFKALGSKTAFTTSYKPRGELIYGIQPILASMQSKRRKCFQFFVKEPEGTNPTNEQHEKLSTVYKNLYNKQPTYVTKQFLGNLMQDKPHQGVVMDASPLDFVPLDFLTPVIPEPQSHFPLWVALNGIQDPQNFGAILRTCVFFGISGIVVSRRESVGLTPVVSKASAGAMEFQVVHEAGNFGRFIRQSKENGWDVIGTTALQSTEDNDQKDSFQKQQNTEISQNFVVPESIFSYKMKKPSIVILGNEGFGMKKQVSKECTKFVYIPHGDNVIPQFIDNINCLNVSVATGIILSTLSHMQKISTV